MRGSAHVWAVLIAAGCAAAQTGQTGSTGATGATGPTGPPASSGPGLSGTGGPSGAGEKQITMADLPAQVRLGLRAEAVRRGWAAAPVVVIVSDPLSYVRAIGGWTLRSRYPVLLDDGSPSAREDIAR